MNKPALPPSRGIAGKLAALFIDAKLTPIIVIASILLGLFAVYQLPREEEPQIKVPMIDVLVAMPGLPPQEIESRITRPLEKLLWEIPDVEYLYATSMPGKALLIVRFNVGTNLETALVRLNQKLQTNQDRIPPGASAPLIKPRSIDDVPILSLTLHSSRYDHLTLYRLASQLNDSLKSIDSVAETMIIGGTPRSIRIQIDPLALQAHNLDVNQVIHKLRNANQQTQAGSRPFNNTDTLIESGIFFDSLDSIQSTVVGSFQGHPVYLSDLASVQDSALPPQNYVLFGDPNHPLEAAVTLSIAKRPGSNAVDVGKDVLRKIEQFKHTHFPAEVELTITRNNAQTAADKSNELLLHMGIAVFGVALLILIFLGWRESLIVLLAIPTTLALTLLLFYLYGYTLNRITLFALIFSIGILVDDAIVVVENIVRHQRLRRSQGRPLIEVALEAVDEVGNPTILATWAVIAAILPMAFVGGLMGPYMRPIPIGSTAAMLFSLIIAFTVTPWGALKVLKRRHMHLTQAVSDPSSHNDAVEHPPNDWFTRIYYHIMRPLIASARWRFFFFAGTALLLLAAISLIFNGSVQVKMLPFDNKSEFQVVLNTPEGTTLEETTRIARELADAIALHPEVANFQIYAGTASPFNFNGLVRHYFNRQGPNMADIQVNLVDKEHRNDQSHPIAQRMRPELTRIANQYGASIVMAEVPPGPPVLQTIVAELYSPSPDIRKSMADDVRAIMENTPGIVDIDDYTETPQPRIRYIVDKEKAAIHHIDVQDVTHLIQMATLGTNIDLYHAPAELHDIPIHLDIPDTLKANPLSILSLHIRSNQSPNAPLIPLSELVQIEHESSTANLYRKNLKPVTYLTADVAGEIESPAYALFTLNNAIAQIDARKYGNAHQSLDIFNLNLPFDDQAAALKWDGEWHITLEVFRDLGIAFFAVLFLISMLMVGWFRSYTTPLIVMAAIPFSLIGILPAHWLIGAFFTATSMIGFMAGAGIVVRNSIILVDFIELRRKEGLPLDQAVVEAGAVRFRPMLLTALAVVVGASVILADPIFQGLAISLMFGEIASLLISRMAVPVLYYMANHPHPIS